MEKAFIRTVASVLLAFSLALALAAAGRPMPGSALSDPQVTAYLAAGGTLADLCTESVPARHDHGTCPECTLSPSTLPGAAALQAAKRFAATFAGPHWPRLPGVPPQRAHPGWSVRAPPFA